LTARYDAETGSEVFIGHRPIKFGINDTAQAMHAVVDAQLKKLGARQRVGRSRVPEVVRRVARDGWPENFTPDPDRVDYWRTWLVCQHSFSTEDFMRYEGDQLAARYPTYGPGTNLDAGRPAGEVLAWAWGEHADVVSLVATLLFAARDHQPAEQPTFELLDILRGVQDALPAQFADRSALIRHLNSRLPGAVDGTPTPKQ
jgi:hypothetical protein